MKNIVQFGEFNMKNIVQFGEFKMKNIPPSVRFIPDFKPPVFKRSRLASIHMFEQVAEILTMCYCSFCVYAICSDTI